MARAARSLLNHLKRPFNAQRSAPLAGRVFFERRKELSDDGDAGHHRPQLVAPPASIHHRLVLVALPRILPQVGHERNVGRFRRAGKQVALDGLEADFPVVVAQRRQVAIVREVEEFVPRPFGDFALEETA